MAVVVVALTGTPALQIRSGAVVGLDRPPGAVHLWGTVGFTDLCVPTHHRGQDVVVTGVRAAHSVIAPRAIAVSVQTAGTPLGAGRGRPSGMGEPYASATPVGSGYRVESVCTGDVGSHLTLLVSLETGPSGADVEGFLVDYTVDGSSRTLDVGGDVTVCGTEETACRHGRFTTD